MRWQGRTLKTKLDAIVTFFIYIVCDSLYSTITSFYIHIINNEQVVGKKNNVAFQFLHK